MSIDALLRLLADGEFHSGEALGEKLGVSRAAIWKQIEKIRALDLPFTSVKGKGYRIDGGLDLLSPRQINNALSPISRQICQVDVRSVVGSTNQLALEQAAANNHGYVCVAEQQTAGRGRRGRPWVSPFGSNIYLSIAWRFDSAAAALEGLSLVVGIVIVEAMSELGIAELKLKWPNDVQHAGRKLAGILVELSGDANGPCFVTIGIGLNVHMPRNAADTIDQGWTDLAAIMTPAPSRSLVVATLLNHLVPTLHSYLDTGFSSYRRRWQSLDALAGQQVCLITGDDEIKGVSMGVDRSGALQLKTPAGKQIFRSGEVSLRGH